MELKEEFQEREEVEVDIQKVKRNQVAPTIFYPEYRRQHDFFSNRSVKKVERKAVRVKSIFVKVEFEGDIRRPRLDTIEEE